MATHSSVLALRIPGMGEPDGLLSMGSHRVGNDWSDLAAAFTGRTDVEAKAPILWPLDAKSWLTGKDSNVGENWGQEKRAVRGWIGWIINSMDMSLNKLQKIVNMETWHAVVHRVTESDTTEQLNSNNQGEILSHLLLSYYKESGPLNSELFIWGL